jgi:hypothetical protein
MSAGVFFDGNCRIGGDTAVTAIWARIAHRRIALTKWLVLLAGLFLAIDLSAATANLYPNEIKGFGFYTRYLAPLRPHQSDAKQVVQVLGSDQRLELKNWKVGVLYSCSEDAITCSHGPRNDPLDAIVITPKHRVSLRHLKFPLAFSHSYGSVSEINVTCDVYTDKFGLQYWVVSSGFPSYKKGDLLRIEYGPAPDSK